MNIHQEIEGLYRHKVYRNTGNKEVLEQVPTNSKTILDVGCGAGDNARILKALNKKITGVTISEDEAGFAAETCDEVLVMNIEEQVALTQQNMMSLFCLIYLSTNVNRHVH